MRIISVINQKGGVGKTTTSVNLADAMARGRKSENGKKILLIDLDPQEDASGHLGVTIEDSSTKKGVYSVITEKLRIPEAVVSGRISGCDVLPSHIDLSGVEIELISDPLSSATRLADALADEEVDSMYDTVIIDCPPSLGILTINALVCSTDVIIPVQTEYFALKGLDSLMNTIKRVLKRNPKASNYRILPVMVDRRRSLDNNVIDVLMNNFNERVLCSWIRQDVRLAEAPSHHKTIFEYVHESNGLLDYMKLAEEVESLWKHQEV